MQTDVTLLQREQRMTANAARAVKATRELVNAVPFLGGSDSEDDYREALELVEYLIEEDDTNPLIDFLASRIAEYENNNEKFAEFDKAVAAMPVGVALLRTLIDQHNLTYADLKNEIGSKSLVSQILSGQRSLTMVSLILTDAKPQIARCAALIGPTCRTNYVGRIRRSRRIRHGYLL